MEKTDLKEHVMKQTCYGHVVHAPGELCDHCVFDLYSPDFTLVGIYTGQLGLVFDDDQVTKKIILQ